VLEHVRQGSGEPLVLLHGIGSQWQMWKPVLDRLAAERDVIAVDLPGFGASPPLAEPTLDGLVDAVAGFAAQLGVERPHVAGNSMGGAVGLELARRGLARSVCCLSPAGFAAGREKDFTQASLRVAVAATRRAGGLLGALAGSGAGRALAAGQLTAKPWRWPAEELRGALRALADAPSFDVLLPLVTAYDCPPGDLGVPATIAWGSNDQLLLPRQAARARRRLPRARHVWLEGCGHVPTWDDPEQVAAVLLAASQD
jgi:pimeloyl-ACP methyl ester carboxylesterase